MSEKLLSRRGAARYLGLSFRTIGKLPIACMKCPTATNRDGRNRFIYRYKQSDLDQFKQAYAVAQAD